MSLQKHNFRSEHWIVTKGKVQITLNDKKFIYKKNDYIFIPVNSIHRIKNLGNTTSRIIEAQIGTKLLETDIIRYEDIYGRIN